MLWKLEKSKIPTITEMRKRLLDKETPLYRLLELDRFSSYSDSEDRDSRTIENWIREICPLPKDYRKGRPSKAGISKRFFDEVVLIPGIFTADEKTINFPKLRFAITSLTRVLKTHGLSLSQIKKSNFLHPYCSQFTSYLALYVRNWIEEAFKENGSIFCS